MERRIEAASDAGRDALDAVRAMPGSLDKADAAGQLSRDLREISEDAAAVLHAEIVRVHDAEGLGYGALARYFGLSKSRVQQIIKARDRVAAEEEERVSEPSTAPEPMPVVAAVVTSARGVLVGRRNDGKPPWTFIAGQIEPGESPAEAAVREVMEETGLRVRPGGVIGRRAHPQTGRLMIYISARPTHGTDASVADEDELAEVRWVSLPEADDLMAGMVFEPVRRHLRYMLKDLPAGAVTPRGERGRRGSRPYAHGPRGDSFGLDDGRAPGGPAAGRHLQRPDSEAAAWLSGDSRAPRRIRPRGERPEPCSRQPRPQGL